MTALSFQAHANYGTWSIDFETNMQKLISQLYKVIYDGATRQLINISIINCLSPRTHVIVFSPLNLYWVDIEDKGLSSLILYWALDNDIDKGMSHKIRDRYIITFVF